jgi:hypothetical protein
MAYEHHHPKQNNEGVISITALYVQRSNELILSAIYGGAYFTVYTISKRKYL